MPIVLVGLRLCKQATGKTLWALRSLHVECWTERTTLKRAVGGGSTPRSSRKTRQRIANMFRASLPQGPIRWWMVRLGIGEKELLTSRIAITKAVSDSRVPWQLNHSRSVPSAVQYAAPIRVEA